MSLIDAATKVRQNAYVPYSKFKVGAAIRAGSGQVYTGCNVENVAYPEGTCAEAGAVAAMVAGGETAAVCGGRRLEDVFADAVGQSGITRTLDWL